MSSSNKKPIAKKCEICARSTRNEKLLGPFIEKKTIAAHYNCVIFNPVVPAKEETAADGIGGVSARFIRNEGKRAKALACVYCKRAGANIGCCRDIGNDNVQKFCSRRYHVDCGMQKRASFTVTSNCGPVSLCFEHRDAIEKVDDEWPNTSQMVDEGACAVPSELEYLDEYDVGGVDETHQIVDQNVNAAVAFETVDLDKYEESSAIAVSNVVHSNECSEASSSEMLDKAHQNAGASTEKECLKEERDSFKMDQVSASLDESVEYYSEDSDVVIVSAYFEYAEEQGAEADGST